MRARGSHTGCRVNYSLFLKKCRERTEEATGQSLAPSKFAKLLKKRDGISGYTGRSYSNAESGATGTLVGLEMMEAAARAAGFEFEDAIQMPGPSDMPKHKRDALRDFMNALNDDSMLGAVLSAVAGLNAQRRKRRPKTGGRTHKKTGSNIRNIRE